MRPFKIQADFDMEIWVIWDKLNLKDVFYITVVSEQTLSFVPEVGQLHPSLWKCPQLSLAHGSPVHNLGHWAMMGAHILIRIHVVNAIKRVTEVHITSTCCNIILPGQE